MIFKDSLFPMHQLQIYWRNCLWSR